MVLDTKPGETIKKDKKTSPSSPQAGMTGVAFGFADRMQDNYFREYIGALKDK